MIYLLRQIGLGKSSEIEISELQYFELKIAKASLAKALDFEQLYEMIILAFLDFENEVAKLASEFIVRRLDNYEAGFSANLKVNLRLVNLLSTAKMYLDQVPRLLDVIVASSVDVSSKFDAIRKHEHSQNKYYRFMEAYRTYVQHNGLPTHSSSMNWKLQEKTDMNSLIEFNVHFFAKKDLLSADPKFKRSVLDEIDEKIDLKHAVRVYVDCLSRIHEASRKMIDEYVNKNRKIIEDARNKYLLASEQMYAPVVISKCDGTQYIEEFPLILNWDDIRVSLRNKNHELINLSRSYVIGTTTELSKKNNNGFGSQTESKSSEK